LNGLTTANTTPATASTATIPTISPRVRRCRSAPVSDSNRGRTLLRSGSDPDSRPTRDPLRGTGVRTPIVAPDRGPVRVVDGADGRGVLTGPADPSRRGNQ